METVENLGAGQHKYIAIDVWLFDPRLYLEPWYVQRLYTLVPNPDKSCRIRYWTAARIPQRRNQDAGRRTDYKGFTFTDKSNNKSNH